MNRLGVLAQSTFSSVMISAGSVTRAALSTMCVLTHESSQGSHEVGAIIICVVQVRTLKRSRALLFVRITWH